MTFDFSSFPILGAAAVLRDHSLTCIPNYLNLDSEEALAAVPLAFWLVELVEPKTVISLDGPRGQVHGAFCEAVISKKLDTDCYIHQSRPPAGRFMDLCKKAWRDHSRPLPALAEVETDAVDLISVEADSAAHVAEIDWSTLTDKLSPSGVMLVYGAGANDVPRAARYGAAGGCVNLGSAEAPLLLILGKNAPGLLLSLVDGKSDASASEETLAELDGMRALLSRQGRVLFLEAWARQQSPLVSDPSTLRMAPPKDMEEAEAQIAQLIEQQAADLEALAAGFAAKEEERQAHELSQKESIRKLEADLARKDEIIATLEARIASEMDPDAGKKSAEETGRLKLAGRLLGR